MAGAGQLSGIKLDPVVQGECMSCTCSWRGLGRPSVNNNVLQ